MRVCVMSFHGLVFNTLLMTVLFTVNNFSAQICSDLISPVLADHNRSKVWTYQWCMTVFLPYSHPWTEGILWKRKNLGDHFYSKRGWTWIYQLFINWYEYNCLSHSISFSFVQSVTAILLRAFPDYEAYSTCSFFQSDWMNEFWDVRDDSDDDYRFVYMGPKGTWTPFHADVFRSFSWSANICGRKRWIFFPPGEQLTKLGSHVPTNPLASQLTSYSVSKAQTYKPTYIPTNPPPVPSPHSWVLWMQKLRTPWWEPRPTKGSLFLLSLE